MSKKFIESDVCKSRTNCIPCRRDPKFREMMEKKFKEKWECPLNLPIDAKDEQFPSDILENYKKHLAQVEERTKLMKAAQLAFEELEMILTGENLLRLESIRTVYFPQTKSATKCKYYLKQIGEVDQVCCGGTVKKVAAYSCQKHTVCTDKKCQSCADFNLQKEVK